MPKIGERYWLISPSTESQQYGDSNPRPPWLGQIMDDSGGRYTVGTVGEDGIDEDTNASALVGSSQLYTSEDAAWNAYIAALTRCIRAKEEDLEELRHKLRSLEHDKDRRHESR